MLNLQGLSGRTVNINDFQMINANLAKVIVSTTGDVDSDTLEEAIHAKLQGQGGVVDGSFRLLSSSSVGNYYVGFLKAVSEVREVDSHELQASYHAVLATNSNVLVNNEDQSVWELKTGSSGKYLVRHQEEDLSSLVASVAYESHMAPRLAKVGMPLPQRESLVAYVTEQGELDYGFVTKTSTANQTAEVVSATNGAPKVVPTKVMTASYEVEIPADVYRMVAGSISPEDKEKMRKFYTELYSTVPDYLEEVIKQINEMQ